MNLFTGRNLNNDECIFDVHSFARELDEDTLRTKVNGGCCDASAPPAPPAGNNTPKAPAITGTTPTTNPGTSPTTNTPNPSDPSNPGSGYTGGGYEPPPEVMSNPQAYGYWKALQDLAKQQGDPDRYKDYNVLGTKNKNTSLKQTNKNNSSNEFKFYKSDWIENIPEPYRKNAQKSVDEQNAKSINNLAKQWAETYLSDSKKDDIEYGSTIYISKDECGEPTFKYTNPNKGSAHGCTPSFPEVSDGNVVMYIHTHGDESGPKYDDENFSNKDLNYADQNKIDGFLITPSGVGKKYSYTTGEVSEIFDILPNISPLP